MGLGHVGWGQKAREVPSPNLKGVFPAVPPFAAVSPRGTRQDGITPSLALAGTRARRTFANLAFISAPLLPLLCTKRPIPKPRGFSPLGTGQFISRQGGPCTEHHSHLPASAPAHPWLKLPPSGFAR